MFEIRETISRSNKEAKKHKGLGIEKKIIIITKS